MYRQIATMMALVALLGGAGVAGAQDLKASLFGDANSAFEAAAAADAELLAPRTWRRGVDYYQDAENRFDRGGNLGKVRADLSRAVHQFEEAVKVTEMARIELASLIKARGNARNVKADIHAPADWRAAERKFSVATVELERGDLKLAQRRGAQAKALYRDLELRAIKRVYLDEVRALLAEADRTRVKRYAPRTLEKARKLMLEAERELEENRYDVDKPRTLARQAQYEARHALYLAGQVRLARDQQLTIEEVILEWEEPVKRIADSADMVPGLDQGHEAPTTEIVNYIEDLRAANQRLGQDVRDRDLQLFSMEEEINQLDQRLGGVSEERVALMKRLEAQAAIRERLEQVESLFGRHEAQVFRESDDIFIRMVGLSFEVGRADIHPGGYDLLVKVREAIELFPRSSVIVEGHTDSHGSDADNLAL